MSKLELKLEGAPNFRDAGGWAAQNGRVRRGRLLRSSHLAGLTDADAERLARLSLALVCDLRLEEERQSNPNRVDPETASRTRHFDIMPGSADRFRSQIMDGVLTPGEAHQAMLDIYAELATKHTEDYARLFRLTAEAPDGPILLHCAAGKDRTGWGVALLLLSVGVSREDVLADYMVSGSRFPVEEEIRASQRDWIEKGAPPVEADALRPLYSVDAGYLETGLDAASASAGSLEGYLRDALGVGPELRRALRARFLSDRS